MKTIQLNKIKNLNVIGLGKLGACMAVCFADSGFKVLGYDNNEKSIDTLKKFKPHIIEHDFSKYLSKNKRNLNFTSDINDITTNSNYTFIIVPTPSLKNHTFDNSYLINVLTNLSKSLKKNKIKQHHFFINSTVMPGSCKNTFIPLIEKYSGLKFNINFTISYNPEFIALGSVIKDFLNPDFLLIGRSSKIDTDILVHIYKKVCKNKPKFCDMSLTSAEITKISLNSYITMKISFANMIGNIADKFDDVSAYDITRALGSDKRVSPYYITPGLPFAGPCFPRDNKAFDALLSKIKVNCKLPRQTDNFNDFYNKYIIEKIKKRINSKKNINTIGVYGLSFKKGSNVTEKSIAKLILKSFKKKYKIIIFDNSFSEKYENHNIVNDIKVFSKKSDIILINHNEKDLFLKQNFKNKFINLWNF